MTVDLPGPLLGLSISEPPPNELTARGLGELWSIARVHRQAYDPLAALFLTGYENLDNGLTPGENQQLAHTDNPDEIVRLVLRGLDRLQERREGAALPARPGSGQ